MRPISPSRRAVLGGAGAAVAMPAVAQSDPRPALTIAVDALWPTLEPVLGFSSSGNRFQQNVFDPLVRRDFVADPNGAVFARHLAEKFERTSPTVWQIDVRRGVKFHNGQDMTAADVTFTIGADRLWGPRPIAARGRSFMRGIKRVTQTGSHTVEIETEFPDPVLANRFVFQIGYVVPDKYAGMTPEEFGQRPIGTGPYRVTEFRPAERVRMTAFDDYWNGRPPARELTFAIVPEFSARLAGLVSGQFDFIVGVPADQEAVFQRYRDITLIKKGIDNYPMFAFDTMAPAEGAPNPLTNADLRKAMAMGVDMPTIVKALWGDVGYHPAPFNFPEYGPFYDPARKARFGFDPARARQFLQRSGYRGQVLRWHIVRGFFPNYEAAAEIMIEQWKELGINVQMVVVDSFDLAYRRPFHLLNMSMGSEFSGDPMRPLWIDWGPGSNRTDASHKTWVPTPRFLELGQAFEREGNLERRKALYLELVAEWEEVMPGFYLWRNVASWAHRRGLKWIPTSTEVMRFDRAHLQVL